MTMLAGRLLNFPVCPLPANEEESVITHRHGFSRVPPVSGGRLPRSDFHCHLRDEGTWVCRLRPIETSLLMLRVDGDLLRI